MSDRTRVLFVCTHNSARSQMAEGLLEELGGSRFAVASAGTEATRVHPLAIQAMAEMGIDISLNESKTIDRYLNDHFDVVITVCDEAEEACPVFPNAARRLHWSFPDPTKVLGDPEARFAAFAGVRDALRERIEADLLRKDVRAA